MTILALLLSAVAGATAFHDTFERAQAAYADGRHAEAVTAYEQLIGEQVYDPVIFHNLGNAYLRLGHTGLAIVNFERALQGAPGMIEAQTNLALAVRGTERQLPRPRPPEWEQSLLFWHDTLTPTTARASALVVWIAFWSLLAMRQWRPFPYARTLIAMGAVLAAATTASAWVKSNPMPIAVAIAPTAPMRHGTHADEGVRFELKQGDRVVLEEQRGEWMRVRVTVGDETVRGWAHAREVMAVGPPYLPVSAERLDALTAAAAGLE